MERDTIVDFIRSEVAKAISQASASDIKVDDWDFQCNRLPEHPGLGWIFVQCFAGDRADIYVLWRKHRSQMSPSEAVMQAPKR